MNFDGRIQVTILRPDLDRAFLLIPHQDTAYEMFLDEVGPLAFPIANVQYDVERDTVEILEGEDTVKYLVVGSDSLGGSVDMAVWAAYSIILTN